MPRREAPFRYNGYTIKWLGWRTPCASIWPVGIYVAKPERHSGDMIYSTTLGAVGVINYGKAMDLGTGESGIVVDVFSTAVLRERAKQWARALMVEYINGKQTSGT